MYFDYKGVHYPEQAPVYHGISSAEKIGAERGYIHGIEDERRKNREQLIKVVRRLKLRGYPIEHIAEDTGFPLEDVANF
jgi:predicted transposase YdaD